MEPSTADLSHLRELLEVHQAKLRQLQTLQARYGLHVPISLLQDIAHHREQVDRLEREISSLEASIAATVGIWDTVAPSIAAPPSQFAHVVANLTMTMCKMLGIVESQGLQRYNGRVYLSVWDATSAFKDTRLPCQFPVLVVRQEGELDGNDVAIIRDCLGTRFRLAILLLFSEQPSDSTRDALAILRQVYAYDIVVLTRHDFENIALARDPQTVLRSAVLSQIDLVNASPFVTTGPAPDNMFFGREKELREITERAATASYAIIGGRRIGKTSILGRLHRVGLPSAGFQAFYYQCQHLPETEPTRQQSLKAVAREWLPDLSDFTPLSFGCIQNELIIARQLAVAGQDLGDGRHASPRCQRV